MIYHLREFVHSQLFSYRRHSITNVYALYYRQTILLLIKTIYVFWSRFSFTTIWGSLLSWDDIALSETERSYCFKLSV